ncbi:MAK16 protein [Giardia duodenalis assemblage B]|uniref:MAK16 protein n=2 Tax=Giardia intestinalis TaxID=5741 RepID=A0A132NRJ5_GIAIN|nr:MAK16 protein [Giardia intestinalis]KWX12691.1 MAK16 protein [Giardia intestinalis assemblage B]
MRTQLASKTKTLFERLKLAGESTVSLEQPSTKST